MVSPSINKNPDERTFFSFWTLFIKFLLDGHGSSLRWEASGSVCPPLLLGGLRADRGILSGYFWTENSASFEANS